MELLNLERTPNMYILEFSNGLVKVGRGKARSRIKTHISMANIFNVVKTKEFTCYAKDPFYLEQLVITRLQASCTAQKSREWFYGVDFDSTVKFMDSAKDLAGFKRTNLRPKPTTLGAIYLHDTFGVGEKISASERTQLLYPELEELEIYKVVSRQESFGRWALFCAAVANLNSAIMDQDSSILYSWEQDLISELATPECCFAPDMIDEAIWNVKECISEAEGLDINNWLVEYRVQNRLS
jgi:hypothetical protein